MVLWNADPPATRCVWEDTFPGVMIGSVRSEVKVMQLKEISSCGSPPSASGESVSSRAAMWLDEAGRIMDRLIDLIPGFQQQMDEKEKRIRSEFWGLVFCLYAAVCFGVGKHADNQAFRSTKLHTTACQEQRHRFGMKGKPFNWANW